MKKKDIFSLLNDISISKNEFIIINDASIVCHGLERDCEYYSQDILPLWCRCIDF